VKGSGWDAPLKSFNPRSRAGSDNSAAGRPESPKLFQSTLPRGERQLLPKSIISNYYFKYFRLSPKIISNHIQLSKNRCNKLRNFYELHLLRTLPKIHVCFRFAGPFRRSMVLLDQSSSWPQHVQPAASSWSQDNRSGGCLLLDQFR
jgi:hypothetical protein